MSETAKFYLCWYQPESGELVDTVLIDVDEAMVRDWFYIAADDPQLDGLIVTASQRQKLQSYVEAGIDLNQYDYLVEYMTD